MSLTTPTRRLLASQRLTLAVRTRTFPRQIRQASSSESGRARPNPVLDAYQAKHKDEALDEPEQQRAQAGDLSASSIFEDDIRVQKQLASERQDEERAVGVEPEDDYAPPPRDPQKIARVLDPNPRARERYERKKVIQLVRKSGRLNKDQVIKRTEREHLLKSHNIKTSQKKLGMLARQIAGKPIEEAILQMRFSKKKAAIEVAAQLEAARDEAIVMRGMGLGNVKPEVQDDSDLASPTTTVSKPLQIQLKSGKRHKITDPTQIYISQAWIGRGPYGKLPDYRARGRVYIMRTPWTHLTLVLKEEKTRIREWEAREAKRRIKALVPKSEGGQMWTQLPDRAVPFQRPWYTF